MICDAGYDQDKIPGEAGEGISSLLRIPAEEKIKVLSILFFHMVLYYEIYGVEDWKNAYDSI